MGNFLVPIAICCTVEFPRLRRGLEWAVCAAAALLMKRSSGPPDLALALTIAATIAYVVANSLPLLDLRVVGRFASTTIDGGAYQLWIQGERLTGLLWWRFTTAERPPGIC